MKEQEACIQWKSSSIVISCSFYLISAETGDLLEKYDTKMI